MSEAVKDKPTHLTYAQAEAILGPYLGAYLKSGHLRMGGGKVRSASGDVVSAKDVFPMDHIRTMADYLKNCSNPDSQATTKLDWPKVTEFWPVPKTEAIN